MRDLEWWEIGVRGLKVPFAQWPTLLASLPPALATGALAMVIATLLEMYLEMPSDRTLRIATTIALLGFEWSWMTALWHSTFRQAVTFPAWRSFWIYTLIFGLFTCLVEVGQEAAGAALRPLDFGLRIVAWLGLFAVVGLPLIWVYLRLAIWPAAIVVQAGWVDPRSIWRATHGLAWDFLLLSLVISIPVIVVGGGGLLLVTFTGLASNFSYLAEASMIGTTMLVFYSRAAQGAATLLAYHDVIVAPFHRIKRPQ